MGDVDQPTDDGVTRAPSPAPSRPASPRLAPGAIITGRYRLIALLGRGGMGEVYRADDLTLDQQVALKFLPDGVAGDDERLAQFHNELRVARQVSHKNVCRLYDLGDSAVDFIWGCVVNGIVVAVFLVLGYVLLRLTLRRTGLAIGAAVILLALVQAPQAATETVWWVAAIEQTIIVVAVAIIVVRFGLLVTAVALGLVSIVANVPLTFALSHWTATTSNLTVAFVLGLTAFGFYASRAGQPIFGNLESGT